MTQRVQPEAAASRALPAPAWAGEAPRPAPVEVGQENPWPLSELFHHTCFTVFYRKCRSRKAPLILSDPAAP